MARPYIGGTNGGVVNCDAATTLQKSDSGKTFYITDTGSAGYTITLPTPANAGIGWNAKFVVNCAAGSTLSNSGGEDVILNDGQTDVMVVHYIDIADSSTASVVHDDAADTVGFDNTATKGDFIELHTDGTIWFAYGISGADGGILVAT
jgi:hypothetical protein